MDDTRATDRMPQTIGRYQIQDSVGFGAMGAVYKAFDPLIKRTLAIKTIRLDIPRQSPQYKSFIERFYHEARISGTLSHPNIVTLFDIGEEGGLPYLAMEYVEGETIASILDRGVKFKPERVVGLVSQIASAVDYAHAKGVIHRDIKPSNLILYEADKVKITDFGIAKLANAELTQSGTLLGTPSYMSPEQAMGEKIDGRSDIFSLGVCAFEMLSGEQPFPGSNVTAILYKLVHVDPIEPANLEMNGLVPQKWHEVFNRVLAKSPDDRYQSATEFVQDLEYCLGAWFGSSMGEETISETAGEVPAGIAAAAAGAPVPRSKQASAKTLPPVPLDQDPATLHLKPVARRGGRMAVARPKATAAPPPGPETDTATVVFKAAAVPRAEPAAAPAPRPAAPAAATPASDGRTVRLDAARPPAPAPAAEPVPATIVMKSSEAARRAPSDVTVKAPPQDVTMKAAAAVAPTIRTSAPPVAAARPPAPAPRPPVPAPRPPAPARPPAAPHPPRQAPPRKGAPVGMILGGTGLVLVVLGIAGVIAYRKFAGPAETVEVKPSPPPATLSRRASRSAAPVAATLHVESEPAGATITLDGQPHGVTPADIPGVPFGLHELKVERKGYAASTQSVHLSSDAPRSDVRIALSRTPAATGAAEVSSDPPGATVRVDGTAVGQTPFVDVRMKTGTHRVEVVKDGYEPWSGTITVQPGKRARVDAPLRAIAVAPPVTVPVDAVDPNRIYVNSPAEVDTPARKVSGTSAAYPTQRAPRLKSGDSVSVRLNFVVTEDGEVTDVRVVESAGRVVDDAVMSAVRRWRYSPAVKKGTAVKVRVEFRQTFRAG